MDNWIQPEAGCGQTVPNVGGRWLDRAGRFRGRTRRRSSAWWLAGEAPTLLESFGGVLILLAALLQITHGQGRPILLGGVEMEKGEL